MRAFLIPSPFPLWQKKASSLRWKRSQKLFGALPALPRPYPAAVSAAFRRKRPNPSVSCFARSLCVLQKMCLNVSLPLVRQSRPSQKCRCDEAHRHFPSKANQLSPQEFRGIIVAGNGKKLRHPAPSPRNTGTKAFALISLPCNRPRPADSPGSCRRAQSSSQTRPSPS